MNPSAIIGWLEGLDLDESRRKILERPKKEILNRLDNLIELGLPYLTLDRASNTLSGGEAQRVRLAHQISSTLSGVLYVLDEPSVGLHPRDHGKLLDILMRLRDAGQQPGRGGARQGDDTSRRSPHRYGAGSGDPRWRGRLLGFAR